MPPLATPDGGTPPAHSNIRMIQNERRATLKRIATLLCSITVLIFFGRAVGGAGGYLAGRGRPNAILWGILGAGVFTWLSFFIWKSYLRDIGIPRERDGGDELPPP